MSVLAIEQSTAEEQECSDFYPIPQIACVSNGVVVLPYRLADIVSHKQYRAAWWVEYVTDVDGVFYRYSQEYKHRYVPFSRRGPWPRTLYLEPGDELTITLTVQ